MSAAMAPAFHQFADRQALARALAGHVARALRTAITERGRGRLVVSGGQTPRRLYEALSRASLDWSKVTVIPADERCVPPDDPHANERLIRETLLRGAAAPADYRRLPGGADDPAPFDVVVLGMGEDGHTASLFPGARELVAALGENPAGPAARCVEITPDPLPLAAPFARLSLSAPALLAAHEIILLITGAAKRKTYEAALAGRDIPAMPVRAMLHQGKTPVTVWWAP